MNNYNKKYPFIIFNLIFIGIIFFSTISSSIRENINNNNIEKYKSDNKSNTKISNAKLFDNKYYSKNRKLITLKFIGWSIFLIFILRLFYKQKINFISRFFLYGFSIIFFGVLAGSIPNPMNSLNSGIINLKFNYYNIFNLSEIIFFIFLTLLVNKIICGWGCPLGVLQDLFFRFNRNHDETPIVSKQIKLSFNFSNSVRILFFISIIFLIFFKDLDVISSTNPFLIFNPILITNLSILIIVFILILSLFSYRPWCHFFCPFGFVSWLAEQFSIYKIRIDKEKCISCRKCIKSCPSSVMKYIVSEKKIKPDCFLCGTCIETCPQNAITITTCKKSKKSCL